MASDTSSSAYYKHFKLPLNQTTPYPKSTSHKKRVVNGYMCLCADDFFSSLPQPRSTLPLQLPLVCSTQFASSALGRSFAMATALKVFHKQSACLLAALSSAL